MSKSINHVNCPLFVSTFNCASEASIRINVLELVQKASIIVVIVTVINPLTAIFPKMPVPKPILDTTQILFATILFVCFDNYNTYCSQFVTHLHFFIDRNLGSSHPSVPTVPWTG